MWLYCERLASRFDDEDEDDDNGDGGDDSWWRMSVMEDEGP